MSAAIRYGERQSGRSGRAAGGVGDAYEVPGFEKTLDDARAGPACGTDDEHQRQLASHGGRCVRECTGRIGVAYRHQMQQRSVLYTCGIWVYFVPQSIL